MRRKKVSDCPCGKCYWKDNCKSIHLSPCRECSVEDWNKFKPIKEPSIAPIVIETFSFDNMPKD